MKKKQMIKKAGLEVLDNDINKAFKEAAIADENPYHILGELFRTTEGAIDIKKMKASIIREGYISNPDASDKVAVQKFNKLMKWFLELGKIGAEYSADLAIQIQSAELSKNSDFGDVLSVSEAAEYIGVSNYHIRLKKKEGSLPFTNSGVDGRQTSFRKEDLDKTFFDFKPKPKLPE